MATLVWKHPWALVLLGLLIQAQPIGAQEVTAVAGSETSAALPTPGPATGLASSPAPGGGDDVWRATVELYGFAPVRTWGTTSIRGFDADFDTSLGALIPLLETVGSARGSVESGRFGLMADVYYAQIGDELARTGKRGLLTGRVEQTAIQGIYDLAFRYRFGAVETAIGTPGQVTVIPYAGVRVLKNQLDLSAVVEGSGPLQLRLEKQGSWGRTWTQPLIGTQASVFLAPGLRAFARGDLGGFGLAGDEDLSGNAQVGLGIALGNSTQLDLSWRYYGLNYSNGAERETAIRSRQNGIEVGLKVFF